MWCDVMWCDVNDLMIICLRSDLQVTEGARSVSARPAQYQEVQHQRHSPGQDGDRAGELRPEEEPQHGLLQLQGLQPGLRHRHAGQGSRGLQVSQEREREVHIYIDSLQEQLVSPGRGRDGRGHHEEQQEDQEDWVLRLDKRAGGGGGGGDQRKAVKLSGCDNIRYIRLHISR